jgi:hypothetical protein
MARRSTITQVRFRLRDGLLQALARAAEGNDRSLNDEVERRLEQSLSADEQREALAQMQAEMRERLDQMRQDIEARLDRALARRKAKQEKAR